MVWYGMVWYSIARALCVRLVYLSILFYSISFIVPALAPAMVVCLNQSIDDRSIASLGWLVGWLVGR